MRSDRTNGVAHNGVEAGAAGGRLLSIQLMRGIAALVVVALHVYVIFLRPDYGQVIAFAPILSKGWIGVNLFFVISGFIIMNAHAKDIDRPSRIPRYLWQRFTRVYPLYWIVTALFVTGAAFGLGHAEFRHDTANIFTTITLLSITDMPTLPLKVAWTLMFEVKFYLVFVVLLLSRRAGMVLLGCWGVAILVRNAFTPLPDWGYLFPDWGMLHMWNIHFLFGIGAWLATRRIGDRHGPILLTLGLVVLAATGTQLTTMGVDTLRPVVMFVLAASFGLIVAGSVLCERRFAHRPPAVLLLIGDASYSVYLVHSAVLSVLAAIQFKLFHGLAPAAIVYLIAWTTAVVAGVLCHLLLERPLLRAIRRHAPRSLRSPAG